MKIAVDVDGVLCDVEKTWIDWLSLKYSDFIDDKNDFIKKMYECKTFHLNDYILTLFNKKNDVNIDEISDFWKNNTLYDLVEPREYSVECITKLVEHGHDVLFVSSCYPEHQRSKYRWLRKHYNLNTLVACPSDYKHLLPSFDIFIDDRPETIANLVKYTNTKKILQYKTSFINLEIINAPNVTLVSSWEDIEKILFIN